MNCQITKRIITISQVITSASSHHSMKTDTLCSKVLVDIAECSRPSVTGDRQQKMT